MHEQPACRQAPERQAGRRAGTSAFWMRSRRMSASDDVLSAAPFFCFGCFCFCCLGGLSPGCCSCCCDASTELRRASAQGRREMGFCCSSSAAWRSTLPPLVHHHTIFSCTPVPQRTSLPLPRRRPGPASARQAAAGGGAGRRRLPAPGCLPLACCCSALSLRRVAVGASLVLAERERRSGPWARKAAPRQSLRLCSAVEGSTPIWVMVPNAACKWCRQQDDQRGRLCREVHEIACRASPHIVALRTAI